VRKLAILLTAALLLFPALPANAEVVRLDSGVTVYTEQDALRLAREMSPGCPATEGETSPEATPEAVAAWVYDLTRVGVPEDFFAGLEVGLAPLESLGKDGDGAVTGRAEAGGKRFVVAACPVRRIETPVGTLILHAPGLWENTFLHELGHLVADVFLGARGYDWTGASEKGREYLKLRGYPGDKPLDARGQAALPWEERASEWFAEDFRVWAWEKVKGALTESRCAGPLMPVVREFFDRLFGVDRASEPGIQGD